MLKRAEIKDMPPILERYVATWCHAGGLFLCFIIPLLFLLGTKKEIRPFVYHHARQAFIIQGVILVASVITTVAIKMAEGNGVTVPIGAVGSIVAPKPVLLVSLVNIMLACVGAFNAAMGNWYRYPFFGEFPEKDSAPEASKESKDSFEAEEESDKVKSKK